MGGTEQQALSPSRAWPAWLDDPYRRGAMCIAAAAVAWSSAGLFTRWAATPGWTTLFWRSVFALPFLLAQVAWQEPDGLVGASRRLRLSGVAMAVAFAASMICFINALDVTRVANVLVFHAASPFVAALFAWAWIRERPQPRVLAAIAATLIGVGVMVSGEAGASGLAGDALGTGMVVCFAATVVLARANPGMPTGAAVALAMLLVLLVSAPFARLHVDGRELVLLAALGVVQMGLGSLLFAAGAKLIPSADVGLISVLETVLGPLWVWLAVGETPASRTFAGGGLVLAAVLFAALGERRRRLAAS